MIIAVGVVVPREACFVLGLLCVCVCALKILIIKNYALICSILHIQYTKLIFNYLETAYSNSLLTSNNVPYNAYVQNTYGELNTGHVK